MRQVVDGRAEVAGNRRLGDACDSVGVQGTGTGAGDDAQAAEAAFLVAVSYRARRFQVAHRGQAALRVVAVQELAAVGADHAFDEAVMVEAELHGLAAAGHQPAVADRHVHTVGEGDLADLATGNAVAGAVRGHQEVVGSTGQRRVVAHAAHEVVVA